MTSFPAIAPSARSYSMGDYPNTPYSGWNGTQTRVRHSNAVTSATVSLRYQGLERAVLSDFVDHYFATAGTYITFSLPNDTWSGVEDPADYTLFGYRWRYASAPIIEDLPYGLHNIEIELESVIPEISIAPSKRYNVAISWATGTAIGLAAGDASAAGATWDVFVEWGEVPPDGETPGQQLEASVTWTPGTAQEVVSIFTPVIYTGNASTNAVTGVGFKPGFVWIKSRGGANHRVFDEVRGTTKYWQSITAQAEQTDANSLTSFDSDGFTLGSSSAVNSNSVNYVAWCIQEKGSTATNNDGSTTTTVAAHSSGAFSTFTYTGTGADATLGHGLGGAAEFVILKRRDAAVVDYVGASALSSNQYLSLSTNSLPATASTIIQSLGATTISIGTNANVNGNTNTYVGHAFRSIAGVCKIGTYTGAATNVTVTTDFEVNFVIIKRISGAVGNWFVYDTARGQTKQLLINTIGAETTVSNITLGATTFVAASGTDINVNGADYLYLAFR